MLNSQSNKIIEIRIKEREVLEETVRRLKRKNRLEAPKEEIENEIKNVLSEIIKKKTESAPSGATFEIGILKSGIFTDEEIRRESINNLKKWAEIEKKKWIKGVWNLRKEDFQGKSISEMIKVLISLPLDRYFLSRYFNLWKRFSEDLICLCDLDLKENKFNSLLERLAKESKELRFLDMGISNYCHLPFSYYQEIIKVFEKNFLHYGQDSKINEIVTKIKEVI